MKTQSGCFGTSRTPDPIDDIGEAADALESIVGTAGQPSPDCANGAAMPAMAALVAQYIDRVRLLTWAVVLMAVVLVAKELKQ